MQKIDKFERSRVAGARKKGNNLAVLKRDPTERARELERRLIKINSYANEMLDMLMQWQCGEKEALQLLESQVRRVRIRDQEEDVAEYRFKDPRHLALRLMAEIKCQLSLYLEIFSSLYDMEAFRDFKDAFLASIGKVNPDLRDQIIGQLRKERLLLAGF